MTDAQALDIVIHISSTIILVEAIALIIIISRMYKKLPKPSKLPFFMTALVSSGVAIFALASIFGWFPIRASPETISVVRSIIMLLMGLPIWIILAMYNVKCIDCPLGREKPGDES